VIVPWKMCKISVYVRNICNRVNISPCKLWMPERKQELYITPKYCVITQKNSQIQHLLYKVHTLKAVIIKLLFYVVDALNTKRVVCLT